MKKATRPNPPSIAAKASTPALSGAGALRQRSPLPTPGRPTRPVTNNGPANSFQETGNLDAEQVLAALMAIKKGDFTIRLPVGWTGIAGKVADTFNEVAELMSNSTEELSRVSHVVGKE